MRPYVSLLGSNGAPLEFGGARISTVEHLLSALAGLGIDNALIDVDAAGAQTGAGQLHVRVAAALNGHHAAGDAVAN